MMTGSAVAICCLVGAVMYCGQMIANKLDANNAKLQNIWRELDREREVNERAIGIQMEIARKQRDEALRAGMEEAAKICDSADELLHGPSWCAWKIRARIGNEETGR